jgi:BON domain
MLRSILVVVVAAALVVVWNSVGWAQSRSGFGGGGSMGMGSSMSAFGGGMGGGGFGGGTGRLGSSRLGGQGGGQNFVGRDATDMSAIFNQMGQASTQYLNQMNRRGGQGGGGRNGGGNQQQSNSKTYAKSDVRVQLNLAFPYERPAPTLVAGNVQARLTTSYFPQGVERPEVSLDGDTVVLRGTATSENQRLVIEKLISMEPGVRQVRNEMIVAATPAGEN